MSSILEALKKAEQESTTGRGSDTPWPVPPAVKPSYRHRHRWRLGVLGVIVVLCIGAGVFWQIRRPDAPRPAASVKAAGRSNPIDDQLPPPVAGKPEPTPAVAQAKRAVPPGVMIQAAAPVASAPLVKPVKKTPRAATPLPAPMVSPLPSPLPREKSLRQTAILKTEPAIVAPPVPVSHPTERAKTAEANAQPVAESTVSSNTFRNDPRIDLQALVWSPETAARFVVINNRLIKEGGSVDNIVVVRINPDDVLLAEGSDRWHEEFKIR